MQSQFPYFRDISTPNLNYIDDNLPKSDVTVQGKGHCIHKFGSVWDQSKQGNAKELLIDA